MNKFLIAASIGTFSLIAVQTIACKKSKYQVVDFCKNNDCKNHYCKNQLKQQASAKCLKFYISEGAKEELEKKLEKWNSMKYDSPEAVLPGWLVHNTESFSNIGNLDDIKKANHVIKALAGTVPNSIIESTQFTDKNVENQVKILMGDGESILSEIKYPSSTSNVMSKFWERLKIAKSLSDFSYKQSEMTEKDFETLGRYGCWIESAEHPEALVMTYKLDIMGSRFPGDKSSLEDEIDLEVTLAYRGSRPPCPFSWAAFYDWVGSNIQCCNRKLGSSPSENILVHAGFQKRHVLILNEVKEHIKQTLVTLEKNYKGIFII